jgi:hypothetical protein
MYIGNAETQHIEKIIDKAITKDLTLEELRALSERLGSSPDVSLQTRRAARYLADSLEPIFGDVQCTLCGGEQYNLVTKAYFYNEQEQWYPELVPERCIKCNGTGIEPYTEVDS